MKRKKLAAVSAITASLAFVWVFYRYDPSSGILFPKCPVHLLFGIPCPGCGSQRAIHSLLHFDIGMAMKYNSFAVFLLPVLAVMGISSLLKVKHPGFYQVTHHRYVAAAFVILIPLWWILRIVFHWYV